MTRHRRFPLTTAAVATAWAVIVLGAGGALTAFASAGQSAGRSSLHARRRTSPTSSYETRSDQVWMIYRRRAAESFVAGASTPGSKGYRRFLSPSAYTGRFGPSAAQVAAVESWLRHQGFTQVRASVNDDYVSGLPRIPKHRTLSVPARLSGDVIAITGPNGAKLNPYHGHADIPMTSAGNGAGTRCSAYWGQRTAALHPAYDGITEATTPVC